MRESCEIEGAKRTAQVEQLKAGENDQPNRSLKVRTHASVTLLIELAQQRSVAGWQD
jgi:hypothetical protein